MPKNTNENLNIIKDKLEYVGLNFENIPEIYIKNDPIEYRTIHENEFKKYKVYKYINVNEIQILITPKNRTDSLAEKYKMAKRIIHYLEPKEEEDIPLQASFIKMLNDVKIEEIEKIDKCQKSINNKMPFKIEYEENYLWEIYYSEAYDKYFMLVPAEDSNYACLFYLIKKQIEEIKNNNNTKIFVPICYMEYTGEYLKKTEIADVENCMWLFTGDWPSIYEVFNKNNEMSIEIIGNTYVYDNLKSYYKITLKTKEESIKFYKFIKALFILQSELPHKYKFKSKINRYGKLELYYKDKKLEYEKLPEFIEYEYKRTINDIQKYINKKYEYEKEIETKKIISNQKDREYLNKEKEITLYLECKRTIFGKIKYYFKRRKTKINIEKKQEENKKEIVQEKLKQEEKQFYTIEDLININKKLEKIELEVKNLHLDIEALKEKINIMDRKIKNATMYIKEIDKHNKSIFDFWRFTNKDEKIALTEGIYKQENANVAKLQKTFKYDTDFENFAQKIDSIQRKNLTTKECNSIFLTSTNILEIINILKPYYNKVEKISKKDEELIKTKLENIKEEASEQKKLFTEEEFDIFGGLSEDNSKVKYIKGKKHREVEKNVFKILDINKNTNVDEFINSLDTCIKEIKSGLEKSFAIVNMPIYKLSTEIINESDFEVFNINIENMANNIKDENQYFLYKINIKEKDNIVYLSNIIYYNNSNKTLPLGMDVSDKAFLDLSLYNLELVNKENVKINFENGLYNEVKTLNIFEYDLCKK